MTDERIDLSALDPGRDPDRIGRIVDGVRAGLARRGEPWVVALTRAWIPALVAAAVAGLLAVAAPRILDRPDPVADPLAISIGVPSPVARWAAAEAPPPAVEVLAAMEPRPR